MEDFQFLLLSGLYHVNRFTKISHDVQTVQGPHFIGDQLQVECLRASHEGPRGQDIWCDTPVSWPFIHPSVL